jgi:hypothetical protein
MAGHLSGNLLWQMSDKQVEADVASKLPTAIDVHGVNFACFVAGSTFIVFLQHSHLQFLDVSADSASTGGGGDDDDDDGGGGDDFTQSLKIYVFMLES